MNVTLSIQPRGCTFTILLPICSEYVDFLFSDFVVIVARWL